MSFWKTILGLGHDSGRVLPTEPLTPPMPPVSPPKRDIVDRLMEPANRSFVAFTYTDGVIRDPVMVEAAREIERLRKAAEPVTDDPYWTRIAKLAGEHGIRYPTNASLLNFLAEVDSRAPTEDDADLECEIDPDGSFALIWKNGYAITAFPNGRVCITKSPLEPGFRPIGCDVSELVKKPD
jgi:hypothetical protein